MSSLTIVADENIPFASEAFGTLGDVRLLHGRRITPADLADADLLFVRSITRVDAALLKGTRVRFVATATAGIDHVTVPDLRELGIAFYAAHGCNANAVAEYMVAAWLTVARRTGTSLRGMRVGVVGVGHVGSRVVEKARALGMVPVLNDPPRARDTGDTAFVPLTALLECDIVTCHTPLTIDGPDPTYRLINESFLARLRRGTWFCNAGRGETVDEVALRGLMARGTLGAVVLDVWDHEPEIDADLLGAVTLGTPHVAGYSLEGKLNGTHMVYDAACRFLGQEPSWDAAAAYPVPDVPLLHVEARERPDEDVLAEVVSRIYPVARDDAALRRCLAMAPQDRGREFDRQRKTYPTRREYRRTSVHADGASPELLATLRGLQFPVDV
jgi:erythronate-4-phosphate dehydrogenase